MVFILPRLLDKLMAIQRIEEEELKEKREQKQGYFLNEEAGKIKRSKPNVHTKRDEIEHNKKERTMRFLRMQRKYSGSHLIQNNQPNNG